MRICFFRCLYFAVLPVLFFAYCGTLLASDAVQPNPLVPLNAENIDYPVPWGLRHGKSARVFLEFDVDEEGVPRNVKVLKSKFTNIYDSVAKSAISKLRYPPGAYRTGLRRELHYCLLEDGVTPIACQIKIRRVSMNGKPVDRPDPLDWEGVGFSIDKSVAAPRVKRYLLPEYPFNIRGKKPSTCGWVRLSFQLKDNGKPDGITILESEGGGFFNNSVKQAFNSYRFEKNSGITEMEYLVFYELPGRCRLAKVP